jgi:hypothetical protein
LPQPVQVSPTLDSVRSKSGRLTAASGGLARLVVILGLLVGLAALHGTHSRQDFQLLTHSRICPTAPVADTGTDGAVHISHHDAVLYQTLTMDPHYPVGVIGMCVALLVSVLLLMIGMFRPGFLGIVPLRTGPQRAVKWRNPCAPSLAMICVLRT